MNKKTSKSAKFTTAEDVCTAIINGDVTRHYMISKSAPSSTLGNVYKSLLREGIAMYDLIMTSKKMDNIRSKLIGMREKREGS